MLETASVRCHFTEIAYEDQKLKFRSKFRRHNSDSELLLLDEIGTQFEHTSQGFPSEISCNLPSLLSNPDNVSCAYDNEFLGFLNLLEIDHAHGMERLIRLVNSELVNFKQENSIAESLVCGTELGCHSETERLRRILVACLSNSTFRRYDDGDWSQSSDEYSDLTSMTGSVQGLRLPALRVLASCLELVAMLPNGKERHVNLSCPFWSDILGGLADSTEIVAESRAEATLSIKCIRLIHEVQPKMMEPFIRYSMLPFIVHANEMAHLEGDRMLLRETTKLLKSFNM